MIERVNEPQTVLITYCIEIMFLHMFIVCQNIFTI